MSPTLDVTVEERPGRVESRAISLATRFGEHVVAVDRRFDRLKREMEAGFAGLEKLLREKL